MTVTSGWGGGAWGGSAWGGSLGGSLSALLVEAVSENVLRVTFNAPVYYSGILDPGDASDPDLWQVTPVDGTVGYDDVAARGVMVVTVTRPVLVNDAFGAVLDLTLDRPMTPWPAQYDVATAGTLFSADKSVTIPPAQAGTAPALFRELARPDPTGIAPGRDFSNPQTLAAAVDSTAAQPQVQVLGSFGYSSDGDYAIDSRDLGLLKRLQRRLFTKKNGFLHLPGYGVGVFTYLKKLGRASARQQLAADCEAQFSLEPEVAQVQVLSYLDANFPNLVRLAVYIKKRDGRSVKYGMMIALQ